MLYLLHHELTGLITEGCFSLNPEIYRGILSHCDKEGLGASVQPLYALCLEAQF